jgi:polyhydroxyalkanoate synthesis regulator phasin
MPDRKPTRAEMVRNAVDDAFAAAAGQAQHTAQSTRDRAQDLVDELAQAAGRVQQALDDLRPATADAVRELRAEVRALAARVEALERRSAGE